MCRISRYRPLRRWLAASLYTYTPWLSHPALGPGPGQLNCPEAGLSRGWSWSLVEPVPESLEPVDMSEVRCAGSRRGRE